jgi:hypothetical protein
VCPRLSRQRRLQRASVGGTGATVACNNAPATCFSPPTNAGSLADYEQLYKRVVKLYELKLRAAGASASLPLRPVDSVDMTECETLQVARAIVDVEVRDVTLGIVRDEMTVTIPPPPSSSAASSVARQERHSTTRPAPAATVDR